MELREFAERVLFATSLEEKLQSPEVITDEHPGPALATPEAPGRPANLQFKPHGSARAEFPGLHRLEQTSERGRLLHFFANHELLATELMALVLLRFPDAPAAFRKGVLQTLKDEQEHTRLYRERIKACGLEFGELPVSGYFWRCVAPMENPIDYVAGLCLTFEQANLDFARHFAAGFGKVGDVPTAKLLEKIYRDEIGHVAYGLKWFRRWKNPNESDWEAFCRTLKFPLSPQRAKGFTVNFEGRRAAGLDDHFIAELNVFSQSKGRTPGVFVFNPFAEGRVAEGKAFNPTKHQAQLARDLESLPQFLCRQDDLVLVERKPSVEFLSGLKAAGFALPEFVERSAAVPAAAPPDSLILTKSSSPQASPRAADGTSALRALAARNLGRLRPWAWGPDSLDLLKPLFPNVTAEKRTPEQCYNPKLARLYSKAWSADFLRRFLEGRAGRPLPAAEPERRARSDAPSPSWLSPADETGVAVDSLADALAAVAAIRARGHHRIVIKEAVGVAGSNALRLFEPELLATHRRWMERALAHRRQLVIEPWLDRVVDFSVQVEMTPAGLKLCGYTGLLNDAKGQFRGNWAESHHHTRIPTRVVTALAAPPNISQLLLQLYAEIFSALAAELRAVDFLGPLGIDAFVYRDATGAARLKPVVEINPRYTMGRLMVELMRQACQGSCGLFRLLNHADLRDAGCDSFPALARRLTERWPLRLAGEVNPRIREGVVSLNDPAQARVCLAVFQVHPVLDALLPKSSFPENVKV